MKALFTSFLLILCFWQGAAAREFTSEEKADLQAQIVRFETALKQGDFSVITDSVPPKVLQHIATTAGITLEQLRSAMQKQIALTSVKFLDAKLDVDNATYNEAPDGTSYVLVPSRSLIESQGQKIEVKSTVLALMDEGKWYLPRIDDARQINLLREVYPFVTTIEFPTRTVTPVE